MEKWINYIFLIPPQLIQKAFDEVRMEVEAGSQRFTECEKMAVTQLDNKTRHSTAILHMQERLR